MESSIASDLVRIYNTGITTAVIRKRDPLHYTKILLHIRCMSRGIEESSLHYNVKEIP